MHIRALRITSSEPTAEEGVGGGKTWDAGDGVQTEYETWESSPVDSEYFMVYFVLQFISGEW